MLKMTNISFAYGEKPVISGLDLALPENGIVALMGPSGVGKTTLLHIMAGLLHPQKGEISHSYRKIAMAFQESRLLNHLNLKDNINFVLSKDNKRRNIAEGLLERFGLSALKSTRPGALSGGEKQRVSLARALAAEADLLLLDEPFAALDEALKAEIIPLVKAANKNGLTVLVTHDLRDAALLGATVYHCCGTPLCTLEKQP